MPVAPTPSPESKTSDRPVRSRIVLRVVIIGGLTVFMTLIALEAGFRMMPQTIPLGACKASLTLAHSYCEYNYQYDDPLRLGYVFKAATLTMAPGILPIPPLSMRPKKPAAIGRITRSITGLRPIARVSSTMPNPGRTSTTW